MINTKKEIACGFDVEIEADAVLEPKVIYGEPLTAIYFEDRDGKYCRVTFEKLDAIRVCRDEYCPYDDDWKEGSPYYWVSKVENSKWLKERHKYESDHYKNAYGFGGNVDEMLSEFSHYLFSFHDQFIEVIAGGLWFERADSPLNEKELSPGHPFLPLPHDNKESITVHGLTCHVWKSAAPVSTLIQQAKYCSQPLMEFAPELDGNISTSIFLDIRYRNARLVSVLSKQFGGEIASCEGVADIDFARPFVEKWLCGVSRRRKEMGR